MRTTGYKVPARFYCFGCDLCFVTQGRKCRICRFRNGTSNAKPSDVKRYQQTDEQIKQYSDRYE